MKEIYLDNAAATPISSAARNAMQKASVLFGNPSSLHRHGRQASEALASARQVTATFLGARPEQVIFTSSGSESNTMAVLRLAEAYPKYKHIITTPIEHKSIIQACDVLKKRGYRITMLPVDQEGQVSAEEVQKAIRKDTLLVSVMYANNEVGTVLPVAKIGRLVRRLRRTRGSEFPLVHTDACQAAAYLPMDIHNLEVDLLSFNSSKVYGPRGVGVLYVPSGIMLEPQVYGGAHERGMRAGTENVPALVGFAAALQEIKESDGAKIGKLRDWTMERIQVLMPDVHVNGPLGEARFVNNINISFEGVTGEQMVLELDAHGISVSTGAACTAHETGPSHVLKALGVPKAYQEAIRISLGKTTTKSDMELFTRAMPKVVEKIRRRNQF